MKRQRQQALLELVGEEALGSQDEIRARLERLGHPATQSTISRDLEELGLVRARGADGKHRYVVAGRNGAQPRVPVETLLREFCVRVDASRNLVVLRTIPGTANAVASGIDQAEMPGVLGTVAGDDTILMVLAEDTRASSMTRTLRKMGGLS